MVLNEEITSHLGMKPVKGGSPPSDKKRSVKILRENKSDERIDESVFLEDVFKKNRNRNKVPDVII